MKKLQGKEINQYRLRHPQNGWGDETCGFFVLPSPIDGAQLRVIASHGGDFDHVSVSRAKRCPNHPEMEFVRKTFFKADEVAMQLGVPDSDHVNFMPYCLHWWRPQLVEIPRPPAWMVGPTKDQTPEEATAEGRQALGLDGAPV